MRIRRGRKDRRQGKEKGELEDQEERKRRRTPRRKGEGEEEANSAKPTALTCTLQAFVNMFAFATQRKSVLNGPKNLQWVLAALA